MRRPLGQSYLPTYIGTTCVGSLQCSGIEFKWYNPLMRNSTIPRRIGAFAIESLDTLSTQFSRSSSKSVGHFPWTVLFFLIPQHCTLSTVDGTTILTAKSRSPGGVWTIACTCSGTSLISARPRDRAKLSPAQQQALGIICKLTG